MKIRYNLNYENGKCPMGYEYVSGYMIAGREITPYCRKIRKYWFSDPVSMHEKSEERRRSEK